MVKAILRLILAYLSQTGSVGGEVTKEFNKQLREADKRVKADVKCANDHLIGQAVNLVSEHGAEVQAAKRRQVNDFVDKLKR